MSKHRKTSHFEQEYSSKFLLFVMLRCIWMGDELKGARVG